MNIHFQYFASLMLLLISAPAQSQTGEMHNGKNSLSWQGTYFGILPCADCPGIETSVTLNSDRSYRTTTRYQERQDTLYEQRGYFSWDADGNSIVLHGTGQVRTRYRLGENELMQLDMEGRTIAGPLAEKFILRKIDDALIGHRWELVELMGKPVVDSAATGNEIFLQLDFDKLRVTGNAGCNRFFGHVELKPGNRITFSKIGSTLMACPQMEIESEFLKILRTTDSYSIRDGVLRLTRARMAPLAVFKHAQ